jgi:hypothetical protein
MGGAGGDDGAHGHGDGTVGAELPPRADAPGGGVLGHPAADRRVGLSGSRVEREEKEQAKQGPK